MGMSGARVGADFLKNEDVTSMLFETHCVCLDVAKDPIEIVFVDS